MIALFLSRRYGSLLDRLIVALAPTSAAPSWFYGMFLILIFAAILPLVSLRRHGSNAAAPGDACLRPQCPQAPGPSRKLDRDQRDLLLHLLVADVFSHLLQRGLRGDGQGERAFLGGHRAPLHLAADAATIITSFALDDHPLVDGIDRAGAVFNWPGLGQLIYRAIGSFDAPVIVGSVVVYAYLLALTVFVLDIVYAIIDPRVKVGAGGQTS